MKKGVAAADDKLDEHVEAYRNIVAEKAEKLSVITKEKFEDLGVYSKPQLFKELEEESGPNIERASSETAQPTRRATVHFETHQGQRSHNTANHMCELLLSRSHSTASAETRGQPKKQG